MLDQVRELLERAEIRAAGVVAGSIVAALVAKFVITRVIGRLADKTHTRLDDEIIEAVRRPLVLTVILIGMWWGALILEFSPRVEQLTRASLISLGIVSWLFTLLGVSGKILRALSAQAQASGRSTVIQPRTIPVFDMLIKIAVVGACVYFALLAWHIDPTAWLASAGILGIAVGFAAKDSLANLFAGIFIVADAPYKVGDMIVLEGNLRGRVTSIGIRSTRILTLDDVELIVPNSTMGNTMIYNEVGGPAPKQRVRIEVSVAYGSDVDKVREVLLSTADGLELIAKHPKPTTRFTLFGDSGLHFNVLVWIENAARRDELVDTLNERIYKALAAAGIEIPYPKRDVYIKAMPAAVDAPKGK